MLLNPRKPYKFINLGAIADKHVAAVLRSLLEIFTKTESDIAIVINANAFTLIEQNAQPVPVEGEYILWHDTTGTVTTPKAHIVTKQNGAVYTFSSKEVY